MPLFTRDLKVARVLRDPGLLLWSLGHTVAWPYRKAKDRREWVKRHRRPAPLGWPAVPIDAKATSAVLSRPGPHLVFVGNGMGEFNMIRRVVETLCEIRPGVKISFALRNNDSIDFVRDRYPGQNVSYWARDGLWNSLRWLASQRPDVVVLTEAYRQPAMVRASSAYGARVMLMNGRCRYRKSFRSPLRRPYYRWLFGGFDAMGMQSEEFRKNASLVAPPLCDLQTTGDLKTDVRTPALPPDQKSSMERWLDSDLPIVGAGSTENLIEERMVLAAFLRARMAHPCRLLLAPRLSRIEPALLDAIQEAGLTVSRRSKDAGSADVLLLDTMFELSTAYQACAAAYVGGGYTELGGGHNVMEPFLWKVPVAYGPRRGNFEAVQLLVEEHGVGSRISNDAELAAFWVRFLGDPVERARVGEVGYDLLEKSRGAAARTAAMIVELLDAC